MASLVRVSNFLGQIGALLHPRENFTSTANLGSLNADFELDSDGCSTVSLDLRGTFNLTVEVAGTVDGANWTPIPVRPVNAATLRYVAAVAGTAAGVWVGKCAHYRRVRGRVTAYASGTSITTLNLSNALLDDSLHGCITTDVGTQTAAAAAITTLTIPAPGAGLRQYLTYLAISRFATATLTAAAAPVLVTSTNLPGSPIFNFPAEAAAQGTIDRWREDFAYPIASAAQNTATTIVCPATTGVIWRVTAGWYVAP